MVKPEPVHRKTTKNYNLKYSTDYISCVTPERAAEETDLKRDEEDER